MGGFYAFLGGITQIYVNNISTLTGNPKPHATI